MPINSVEELFKRLNDPDAGYKVIEELEQRDRQRWLKNMLRRPAIKTIKCPRVIVRPTKVTVN